MVSGGISHFSGDMAHHVGYWEMSKSESCESQQGKKILNDEQAKQIRDIQSILGALDARLAQFEQ